jgi:hypothetical protein
MPWLFWLVDVSVRELWGRGYWGVRPGGEGGVHSRDGEEEGGMKGVVLERAAFMTKAA